MQFERRRRAIQSRETWLEWRKPNIGASDVAALFGCHPYMTPLKLWAHFRGEAERETQDNAAMRRGRIFEAAVLSAYQEERPELYLWSASEYHEIPSLRLGATPDAWCGVIEDGRDKRLVQIKTTTPGKFDSEWIDGPPIHYVMQLQAEMLVTGATRGALVIMVMDGFNFPIHEYTFDAEPKYHDGLVHAVKRFWESVESGERPRALAGDQETLATLHPNHIPASTIALGGMPRVVEAIERKRAAEAHIGRLIKEIEACKAVVCEALGNHAEGVLPGWKISWVTVKESHIAAHIRRGYRRLTISKERG